MASSGHGGPGPDLYQVLGVARDASAGQIALAWRRRARAEHPDARPADADAASRFRALAEAYQVLSHPARRAAYDRALSRGPQPAPAVRIPVRRPGPAGTSGTPSPTRGAGAPPVWAGPVRVEGPRPAASAAPVRDGPDAEQIRLAAVAELALRFLAAERRRPW
jgi:curved DNA-binding protein CbpA